MNFRILGLFTALPLVAALLGGCAATERSRALGDPAVTGATLADQVCSNCHGRQGLSVSPNFPKLAAQQSDYLTAQLTSFRDQQRRDPQGFEYMWGLSRHLTDAQIGQLAAYFAAQPASRGAPAGETARVEAGRVLFTQGDAPRGILACNTCHGEQGQGNGAFPRLAGQHADYLVKQLEIFQRNDDQRPLGSVMKVVAHKLTPEDVRALAAYAQQM